MFNKLWKIEARIRSVFCRFCGYRGPIDYVECPGCGMYTHLDATYVKLRYLPLRPVK